MKRYPAGPVTPHGAWHLRKGRIPNLSLTSHDETIRFELLGGKSIADRRRPESVRLKKDGIKGLIPPWQMIDQKGATEDGVTYLDALYDPIEVSMEVKAIGRDPQHRKRLVHDLIASIDVKNPARLAWFDHDFGHWWADLRWFKTPANAFAVGESRSQNLTLVLRADHGFWESHPDASQFRFSYADAIDEFNYTTPGPIGTTEGWDVAFTGSGGGYPYANGDQLVWKDDPNNPILTDGRTAILRRRGSQSTGDMQVVEIELGSFSEWSFPDQAKNQVWGRMPATGTPGQDGICLTFGVGVIRLSSFKNGVETVLREQVLWIPPWPGDHFTLICGYDGDPRLFKVQRNGLDLMVVKEQGTSSQYGPGFRAYGAGMQAGAAWFSQATPAAVARWNAGDNAKITQAGYVECLNIGDQRMYRDYTCFGPGLFRFGNGPDSTDMIEFGPLLDNQIVYLRSDPRRRAIVDLTSIPPTPQQLDWFQKALKDFYSFASGNNISPLDQAIMSQWGIRPPQGNLFSLLNGRFSTESAIPAAPAGEAPQSRFIKVEIVDGNADSKIISSGTPLRRYPL